MHLGYQSTNASIRGTDPGAREGRQAAERLGIKVKGVLGILLRAQFADDLPAVGPEIESLESKAGFRIAPALRQKILQAAGE